MKNHKTKIKLNKRVVLFVGIVLFTLLMIGVVVKLVTGRVSSSSPKGLIKEYFEKYHKEDKSITSKIIYPFSDKLNSYQEQRYKELIKKQYRNLGYKIIDEYVGDVDSNYTIQVTVVDLKDTYEKANSYVTAHKDKFLDSSGNMDDKKVIDYKLEQLEKAVETMDYSITINLYKNNKNQWIMADLSSSDLEKINGTF